MAGEIRPDVEPEWWPPPAAEPAEARSHPAHIPDALGLGRTDLEHLEGDGDDEP